jgi:hypothetical protein
MNLNPGIGADDVHISEEAMEQSLRSTAPKKPLWCIAYEEVIKGKLTGDFLYVHATDAGDAMWQYLASDPGPVLRKRRIVGVSQVIGYFVHDNHGDELSV